MDWNRVIERNREALKRVLAALVAMAGLDGGAAFTSPLWGSEGRARQATRPESEASGGGSDSAITPTRRSDDRRPPHKGEVEPQFPVTLPRHLHRAVLRLLRPAESAARRLIVVAARDLVLELPPPRPRKPKPDPKAAHAALRALGIAVTMSPAHARAAAAKSRRPHPAARSEAEPRRAVLPLFDPPQYPFRIRRRTVPPHRAPRILSFGDETPHRLPPPPAPDDPVDATRLALRLQALASALDDLPGQARRFARWRARMAQNLAPSLPSTGRVPREARRVGCARRISPLRPGRPPGQSGATRRKPTHEIHEVLADLQYFAFKALQAPDTS